MQGILRLLRGMETGLTGLLALAAAMLTVSESVIRYISPAALPDWSAEVTVYCIGWAVMLTAGRLVRENLHVSVDMLVDVLPPAGTHAAEIFTCVFGVVVSAGIVYAGLLMVDFALMLGEQSDSSIRFPMWLYYLAIPVGFGLTSLQYALRLARLVTKRGA